MTDISVVIPVYRDDFELEGLLPALARLSVAEIIIVDGEHRTPPSHLKNSSPNLNIRWRNARAGRGSQIAAGIEAATQPIIWVLHADCRPTTACLPEITRHLAESETSLTCFPLTFSTDKPALSLFAFLSRIDSLFTTFGDQGFAFRRADYKTMNFNLAQFPLLEDVALRQALRKIGRVRKAKTPLLTSARRFDRLGVWRTQLRNVGILMSYWRGTSPAALHAQYYAATPKKTAPKSRPSWPARLVSERLQAAGQKTASD